MQDAFRASVEFLLSPRHFSGEILQSLVVVFLREWDILKLQEHEDPMHVCVDRRRDHRIIRWGEFGHHRLRQGSPDSALT